MGLSRDHLSSDYFKKLADLHGGPNQPKALSHEELEQSLNATMAIAPTEGHVWIFGYGSLIWNPLFEYEQRELTLLHGYRRRFCLKTELSRGTPDKPGLVLGLEPGGSCRGLAYRIGGSMLNDELKLLWRREMLTGAYCPRWVKLRTSTKTLQALTFVMNRQYPFYTRGLTDDATAEILATAAGPLGSCAEYLFNTESGLAQHNITDAHLTTLTIKVRQLIDNPPTTPT